MKIQLPDCIRQVLHDDNSMLFPLKLWHRWLENGKVVAIFLELTDKAEAFNQNTKRKDFFRKISGPLFITKFLWHIVTFSLSTAKAIGCFLLWKIEILKLWSSLSNLMSLRKIQLHFSSWIFILKMRRICSLLNKRISEGGNFNLS